MDWFSNPAESAFKWLTEKLTELFKSLIGLFEQILIHPPRPDPHAIWQQELFGQGLNVAKVLACLVLAIAAFGLLILQTKGKRLLHTFVTASLIGLAGYLWYPLTMQLVSFGDSFTSAALFFGPEGTAPANVPLISMPIIDNPIGGLLGYGAALFFGGLLAAIAFAYELINILVRVGGLWFFAFKATGPRGETLWRWMVNISIVSMILGRPLAVFCLELGRVGIAKGPLAGTVFGAAAYTVMALIAAIAAQLGLLFMVNFVYTHATGGHDKTTVDGKVDTTEDTPRKVDIDRVNSNHADTMQPRDPDFLPVDQPSPQPAHTETPVAAQPAPPQPSKAEKTAGTVATVATLAGQPEIAVVAGVVAGQQAAKRQQQGGDA